MTPPDPAGLRLPGGSRHRSALHGLDHQQHDTIWIVVHQVAKDRHESWNDTMTSRIPYTYKWVVTPNGAALRLLSDLLIVQFCRIPFHAVPLPPVPQEPSGNEISNLIDDHAYR